MEQENPEKTHHVLYFRKAGTLRISIMILRMGVATISRIRRIGKIRRIRNNQQKVRKSAVLPTSLMSFF